MSFQAVKTILERLRRSFSSYLSQTQEVFRMKSKTNSNTFLGDLKTRQKDDREVNENGL